MLKGGGVLPCGLRLELVQGTVPRAHGVLHLGLAVRGDAILLEHFRLEPVHEGEPAAQVALDDVCESCCRLAQQHDILDLPISPQCNGTEATFVVFNMECLALGAGRHQLCAVHGHLGGRRAQAGGVEGPLTPRPPRGGGAGDQSLGLPLAPGAHAPPRRNIGPAAPPLSQAFLAIFATPCQHRRESMQARSAGRGTALIGALLAGIFFGPGLPHSFWTLLLFAFLTDTKGLFAIIPH